MALDNTILQRVRHDIEQGKYDVVANWLGMINTDRSKTSEWRSRLYTPAIVRYIYEQAGQVSIIRMALDLMPFDIKLYVIPEIIQQQDVDALFESGDFSFILSDMTTFIQMLKTHFPSEADALIDQCILHCYTKSYDYKKEQYTQWLMAPSLKEEMIRSGVRNINKWSMDILCQVRPFMYYLTDIVQKKLLTPKRLKDILYNKVMNVPDIMALYNAHQHEKYQTIWSDYHDVRLPHDREKEKNYGTSDDHFYFYLREVLETFVYENIGQDYSIDKMMSMFISYRNFTDYVLDCKSLSSDTIYDIIAMIDNPEEISWHIVEHVLEKVSGQSGFIYQMFEKLQTDYQIAHMFDDEDSIEKFWSDIPDYIEKHWEQVLSGNIHYEEGELHL